MTGCHTSVGTDDYVTDYRTGRWKLLALGSPEANFTWVQGGVMGLRGESGHAGRSCYALEITVVHCGEAW